MKKEDLVIIVQGQVGRIKRDIVLDILLLVLYATISIGEGNVDRQVEGLNRDFRNFLLVKDGAIIRREKT